MPRTSLAAAVQEVAARDPVMGAFIGQAGRLVALSGMHHGNIVELNPEATNTVSGSPCCDVAQREWQYASSPRLGGNVRWALGSNLWNYFPHVPFTDILDVMRDTGFIGVRVTQFPQILTTYNITTAELEKEVSKRNLHVITISFNGPAHDASKRADVIANAKKAMGFLKNFGASRLVVFSPSRSNLTDENFKTMCECYNQLGEAAGEMGFRAGLHNHLGQMVQDAGEVDKCMAMTDPKLFSFSPDTAHLFLADVPVAKYVEKLLHR